MCGNTHQFQCIMDALRLVDLQSNGRWVYSAKHTCMQIRYIKISFHNMGEYFMFSPMNISRICELHVGNDSCVSLRIQKLPWRQCYKWYVPLTNGLYICALFIVYSVKINDQWENRNNLSDCDFTIEPWAQRTCIFGVIQFMNTHKFCVDRNHERLLPQNQLYAVFADGVLLPAQESVNCEHNDYMNTLSSPNHCEYLIENVL